MDRQAVLAADAAPPLGTSRAHVLDLLRAAADPVGVREMASQAGLHPNTARFHLDGLAGAGLAIRAAQPRSAPGRPSMTYRAAPAAGPAGERRYRLLAEMLATMIHGLLPEPALAAADAGQAWGRYLTEGPPPGQTTGAAEATAQLTAVLEQAGFDPEAGEAGDRIGLRRCPFQEVARQHPDVVCALHLGLMQGALEQLRAPVTASRLEPFAEPGLCIAHLAPRPVPDSAADRSPQAGRAQPRKTGSSRG